MLAVEIEIRVGQEAGLTVVPFDDAHWTLTLDAYARFGKGRHSAGLNFGDCFAYALANDEQAPLLFKGADFGQTDVAVTHY